MIEERIKIPSLIYSLNSITLAIAIFFGNAANLTKSTIIFYANLDSGFRSHTDDCFVLFLGFKLFKNIFIKLLRYKFSSHSNLFFLIYSIHGMV